MKTYIAQIINPHGNGYAIVNASNPKSVEDIIRNQSRFHNSIVASCKELVWKDADDSIIYEGAIVTLGKSAYDLAVLTGYKGTLEEWLSSMKGVAGDDGNDGVSVQDVTLNPDNSFTFLMSNGNTITTDSIYIEGGGEGGQDGVGIQSIQTIQSTQESRGANIIRITLTNGNTFDFNVYNGAKGDGGDDGQPGNDGATPEIINDYWYINGSNTGVKAKGEDGHDGSDGRDGSNGADGVTPHIDSTTGNWFIGSTDTLVHAQGPAGTSPTLNYDNVPTNNSSNLLTSGTVFTALQGKEDKVAIITPTLNNNAFDATVGNYYKVTGNASAIDITLATPSDTSHLSSCIFLIDNSNGVGVSFHTQNLPFYQAANFAIATGKVYEVNALFNGIAWYLTQVEMEVQS